MTTRRFIAAVIGDARTTDGDLVVAETLGRCAVEAGFRLVTGGLGGIMAAASRGARSAPNHQPGDVIGILPTYSADDANEYVEIPICTGMNHARNVIVVATADVIFAVGGKSGTMSELAIGWKLGKPIIAVGKGPGWAGRLAGTAIDDRRDDHVHGPLAPFDAVALARTLLSAPRPAAKVF